MLNSKQDLSKATTPTNQQTPQSEIIYQIAKHCLDTHITENENIPAMVGCAEAVSYILVQAGYSLPKGGIAGTASLYSWLKNHSSFKQVTYPLPGDVIISPTGMGNGTIEGHTGIVAIYGILSNNSYDGLFEENYKIDDWIARYVTQGGLPMFYFRAL